MASVWTHGARRESAVPFAAAAAALLMAGLSIIGLQDFLLDDAWIHLAYAKSLRLGEGLSYNPHDFETGFSSPLWVLTLAVWPLGAAPVVPVQLLGVLLHAGCAYQGSALTMELAREHASEDRPLPVSSLGLLAGMLIALEPQLVQLSISGMEVPLCVLMLLSAVRATVSFSPGAAAALGALCVLARPESLGFAAVFGLVLLVRQPGRRRHALFLIAGASAGLLLIVIYCLAVSGHPFPNPQYIKGTPAPAAGLAYLSSEVLPRQAWLISLGGVVLIVFATGASLRNGPAAVAAMVLAAVATMLTIAVTRELHPGAQIYESRYFAIVAFAFPVAIAFGATRVRRRAAGVCLALVAIASGTMIAQFQADAREFAADTRATHTAAAHWVARKLPPDAVLLVEGAGAMRYWTPREMRILDAVGLNDSEAAHLHYDTAGKLCYFVSQRPTHLVIPSAWVELFSPVFVLSPVQIFDDPHYTQVLPARAHQVLVLAVLSVTPHWTTRCRGPSEDASTGTAQTVPGKLRSSDRP